MPEIVTIDFKGLYTYPNQFGEGPKDSLATLGNVSMDAPGVVDCRRGRLVYSSTAYTSAIQGLSFDSINGHIVEHTSDGKLNVDNGTGVFTPLTGTYTVPDTTNVESRIRSANINNNLFFTSGQGVYKLQSNSSTPIPAGAPQGLGGSAVTTGSSGFLVVNQNVAYRIVWLYIDTNNNLVQGAPSDRIVVGNSSGTTTNVSLTFLVPTTVDPSWTFQVYRSNQSASLATEPDDQMQQVYQGSPTSGQITARTITITDSDPDNLRGQTLYTTAQGIQNANTPPPYSADLALFKGSTFYANCSLKQTFFATLISGALLVNGDTISFYRGATLMFTVTGAASENAAAGQFLVSTGGSPAQNITLTAQSLVRVINLYASNTAVDAFYSSGFSQSPGAMTFIDRAYSSTAFNVVCSRTGNVFNPPLPASGITNTNTSSGSRNPHYVYFSKSLQPEAVPLYQFLAVGSSAYPIVRILPLRNSLMVIKTDGWYQITGNDVSSFSVVPVDVQLRIAAVNSAVVLDNSIYAMTEQGLVVVQDSGAVQIISIPIQRDLISLNSTNFPGYKGATWAMAYPSDQKYYLFTVSGAPDVTATQCYTYNYITQNWSNENKVFTAGFVNPTDGKAYFSTYNNAGTQVYVERKTESDFDYADEEFAVNIVSSSNLQVTLTSTAQVSAGMTLGQGALFSYITAVVGNVVTVSDPLTWAAGAATAYTPITMTFTTNPIDAGDPTLQKQFPEISMVTLASSLTNIRVSFVSDNQQVGNLLPTITQPVAGGYGIGVYGAGVYGGGSAQQYQRTRMLVPKEAQKGNWLIITFTIAQAFKRVRFSVLQVVARKVSIRQR